PNVGKSNILEAIGLYSSLRLIGEDFKFNDICRVKRLSEVFFNKEYRNPVNVNINEKLSLELTLDPSNDLDIKMRVTGEVSNDRDIIIFWAKVLADNYKYRYEGQINEPAFKKITEAIRKYEFRNDGIIDEKKPLALAVPFGSNLLEILHADSVLRKEIANLFEVYDQKLVIDDDEISFFKYIIDDTVVRIPYHLISDTLRRLIFYKAAILSNRDSILLFEEPEAHMFPPYIKKFTADVIFDKTNQFFIATHSPYVLDELIAEAGDDLSVYLVDYKEGETKIYSLKEDDLAEIREYGVDLFFNIESYLKHGHVNNA
ncbi:MAG TPA: AAA family ATPase, partial [Puia sp.]